MEARKKTKYNGGEVQVRHVRSEQNDATCRTQKSKSKDIEKKIKDKTPRDLEPADTHCSHA